MICYIQLRGRSHKTEAEADGITLGANVGISYFLMDTPWYFLACVPLMELRRVRRRWIYIIMVSLSVFRSVVEYLLLTYGTGDLSLSNTLVYWTYTLLILVFFCRCFRVHPVKLLYVQLLLQALATAVNMLITVALTAIFPGEENTPYTSLRYALSVFLVIALLFPAVYLFMKRTMREALHELSAKGTLLLCVPPLFFFILQSVIGAIFRDRSEISDMTRVILGLLVALLGLVTHFVNIRMYLEAVRHTRVEKNLTEQNELLDAMSTMKDEFYAHLSHDMKTPLTVVSAAIQFAYALLEAEGGSAQAREAMRDAQAETMRIARLVSGTLNLSAMRESSRGMKRMDIANLARHCAEAYRLMIEKRGNALELDIGGAAQVFGSADMLAQVIANLLDNANRHTNAGRILLRVSAVDGGAALTVEDTGTGIARELLPQVFERGVSGSGGTGYGLYLCKSIAEKHGGGIDISSVPGKGTAVTLWLPWYEGRAEEGQVEEGR